MSPMKFYDIVKSLNKEQKKAVREMGLGSLLRIATNGISGKLAHFVVNLFNPLDMKIHLPNAKIDITLEPVHDLLGIPLDYEMMVKREKAELKSGDFGTSEWNDDVKENDEEFDTDENEDMKLDDLVFKAKKNYKKTSE
ncbi:unnamed protein product [Lactuca saligna]|uniref:Uncharacterized protein n=1 Tax=Lactuca saligna TaxID=75948 RepID=A0AA36EFG1_LACSI|nr:unnamed protein product [Lactuca saligna]